MRIVFLIIFFVSSLSFAKSWQGTFYPKGCLDCSEQYEFSPVFNSFKQCKKWAESKMVSSADKSSCGKNCEYQDKMDMSKCEIVVRSWYISFLPDSPTLKTYKEGWFD